MYNDIKVENRNIIIKFFWVPSHIGIIGNETADSLAKSATIVPLSEQIDIPFSDYFEIFKKQATISTNQFITNLGLTKGKKYFESFYNSRTKPWFTAHNFSRDFIVTINRCRTNHYNLAASLSRVRIVKIPQCECKCENEDLNHVIWQCSIYNQQRSILINKLLRMNLQLPLQIENLLTEPHIQACKHIFEFFKQCNKRI